MKSGEKSISVRSRVASRKCRGKDKEEDLQDLMAQVRKFVVRSFIVRSLRTRMCRLVVAGCRGGSVGDLLEVGEKREQNRSRGGTDLRCAKACECSRGEEDDVDLRWKRTSCATFLFHDLSIDRLESRLKPCGLDVQFISTNQRRQIHVPCPSSTVCHGRHDFPILAYLVHHNIFAN